jgi:O-acetylhomoserine/O-acetylserine sulfhydrylase-like pyridoxal-dependent enzyme
MSTRAIHGCPAPSGPGEPLIDPIVASTTFVLEDASQTQRVMGEEEYGFL